MCCPFRKQRPGRDKTGRPCRCASALLLLRSIAIVLQKKKICCHPNAPRHFRPTRPRSPAVPNPIAYELSFYDFSYFRIALFSFAAPPLPPAAMKFLLVTAVICGALALTLGVPVPAAKPDPAPEPAPQPKTDIELMKIPLDGDKVRHDQRGTKGLTTQSISKTTSSMGGRGGGDGGSILPPAALRGRSAFEPRVRASKNKL